MNIALLWHLKQMFIFRTIEYFKSVSVDKLYILYKVHRL